MTFRLLLVATLALGLTACADDAAPASESADVSVAGSFENAPDVPAGEYTFDVAHSRAEFRIKHLGISTVTGRFDGMNGTLTITDGIESLQATATIDASTISTGNDDRDNHLKSPDFFDVATYPEITFTSTEVRPGEGNAFTLVGDLTMHGVTRPVELTGEYVGASAMQGTPKVGFTASGEITRQDWGLTWEMNNELGEAVVGDTVTLVLEVEADGVAPDAPADAEPEA
ncbi:YceI family protein [Rubrivirga sp. IMCC43871]|uniref:YceI family protein n=1 Tax=Rubrivirga sp. IMCC43871 TaxID=3391575 RepID=UPI0039902A85